MPGEIPVERPTTLALRINRKVADALGLMFPYGLLSVIERILCPLLMLLWTTIGLDIAKSVFRMSVLRVKQIFHYLRECALSEPSHRTLV